MIATEEIERVFRDEFGRAVAVLARVFGDLDVAEEAVSDAFTAALERWPKDGVPPSPAAWIVTTAKHRAIDRLRKDATREGRLVDAARSGALGDAIDGDVAAVDRAVSDDRLSLIFTCCHPALALDARVALSLRLLCGLTTAEIAHAFLVPEATLAQRLVRAKAKIRDAGIPYRVPSAAELPARRAAVFAVVYLVFTEGHLASAGDGLVRSDLCAEAIRLGRLLVLLFPDEPEAAGLLALMLLVESRRRTRVDADGALVRLADQDRGAWNRALIDEGQSLVRACIRRDGRDGRDGRGAPGPYQIQAAIQAVHSDSARADATDWRQIVALYDQLLAVAPGPIVRLNRAVAVAEVDGPRAALALVEALAPALGESHLFHAVRADLLARLSCADDALRASDAAIERAHNATERRFLERRRAALAATTNS